MNIYNIILVFTTTSLVIASIYETPRLEIKRWIVSADPPGDEPLTMSEIRSDVGGLRDVQSLWAGLTSNRMTTVVVLDVYVKDQQRIIPSHSIVVSQSNSSPKQTLPSNHFCLITSACSLLRWVVALSSRMQWCFCVEGLSLVARTYIFSIWVACSPGYNAPPQRSSSD